MASALPGACSRRSNGPHIQAAKPVLFLANRFAAKERFEGEGHRFRYPVTCSASACAESGRQAEPGFHPNLERLVQSRGIVGHHVTISDEVNSPAPAWCSERKKREPEILFLWDRSCWTWPEPY